MTADQSIPDIEAVAAVANKGAGLFIVTLAGQEFTVLSPSGGEPRVIYQRTVQQREDLKRLVRKALARADK